MKFNDLIKQQLVEYIQNPAILVDKNDIPYEYRKTGSINRLKRRRTSIDIPYELYSFLIENNISRNQLTEFASGLFLNYVETTSIYR